MSDNPQGQSAKPEVATDEVEPKLCDDEAQPTLCDDEAQPKLYDDEAHAKLCDDEAQPTLCDDEAQPKLCDDEAQPKLCDDEAHAKLTLSADELQNMRNLFGAHVKKGAPITSASSSPINPEPFLKISYPIVSRALIYTMVLTLLAPLLISGSLHAIKYAHALDYLLKLVGFGVVYLSLFMVIIVPLLIPAKIDLTAEGISFSRHWLALGRRRRRTWDDLHSVQLVYPGISVPEDSPILWRGEKRSLKSFLNPLRWSYAPWLMLDFESGGTAKILSNRLTRKQAQDFLKALETHNSMTKFASEVVSLERSLVLEQDEIVSFTKMWEDQLNSQYISTNYVPLPTNYVFESGNYKIVMELAAGGMSAVYLATDDVGKTVVVKEAVTPPGTDERQILKSRELFMREARLLMKLNHPQIAKVHDYFVERNRDYLVLEYVKGRTLKQLVKEEGKQKEAQVLQWAKQIAEILEYLHEQNPPVLHRDLTPDNLILSDKGRIKLVDFGAASEYVGNATGTFIGKQCYIPPEQLRGKAVPQSDFYALGATINFLLTGKEPVALAQSRPKDIEPGISEPTNQLVAEMTELEAGDRLSGAQAIEQLEALSSKKKAALAKKA